MNLDDERLPTLTFERQADGTWIGTTCLADGELAVTGESLSIARHALLELIRKARKPA